MNNIVPKSIYVKFSDTYKVKLPEDCLDSFLNSDINLFIDPFLLIRQNGFENGFDKIGDFFEEISKLTCSGKEYLAKKVLQLTEVKEVGLGYSEYNTNGRGAGKENAKNIYSALKLYLSLDLFDDPEMNYRYFEVIGFFGEGIGPDKISDITSNIMKEELIIYTQKICKEMNIPMVKCGIEKAKYNFSEHCWEDGYFELPINPFTKRGIILVPKYSLRELPTVNSHEFINYVCLRCGDTEELKKKFGRTISRNMTKPEINDFIVNNPNFLKEYLINLKSEKSMPYNLQDDPHLKYKRLEFINDFLSKQPIHKISNNDELEQEVINYCHGFKKFIEENRGYKLLWYSDKYRSEKTTQTLFYGCIEALCHQNNIDLNPETDHGKGPIDFKFSNGSSQKLGLEIKYANSKSLWDNLENQLPTYMSANNIIKGIYLIVIFDDDDNEKKEPIKNTIKTLNENKKLEITSIFIDARQNNKLSASKIKSNTK